MCCGGCTRVIGLIFLIIAAAACVISFIAPFWVYMSMVGASTGLWGTCAGDGLKFKDIGGQLDGCTWFSDSDFQWEKSQATWVYACQGLSSFGILLMVLAIPTGIGSLCCCKSSRLAYFTGITTIFACLLHAASICVWGYFFWDDSDTMDIKPFVNNSSGKYVWGYYIGIAGVILGFVAGGFFFDSRKKE